MIQLDTVCQGIRRVIRSIWPICIWHWACSRVVPMTHRILTSKARRPAAWPMLWLCAFVTVGCAISPKPEPPEASLNLGGVRADTLVAVFGDLDIVGKPGTAQPPGALIRAYPLDTSDPPIEATVKPDGSFELLGV